MESSHEQMIAVTPQNSTRYGLLIAGLLIGVLVCLFIAIQSPPDLYVPRSWFVSYNDEAVGTVLESLQQHGVLPHGVEWENASLKDRKVSVRWLTATDAQALAQISEQAQLEIVCPVGYHGDITGPITVRRALKVPGLVFKRTTRR